MRVLSYAAAALAGVACAEQSLLESIVSFRNNVTEVSDAGLEAKIAHQSVSKNKFGCVVEETVYEHPYVEKTIKAPLVPFHMDYV